MQYRLDGGDLCRVYAPISASTCEGPLSPRPTRAAHMRLDQRVVRPLCALSSGEDAAGSHRAPMTRAAGGREEVRGPQEALAWQLGGQNRHLFSGGMSQRS
jgi:hypothetical protein